MAQVTVDPVPDISIHIHQFVDICWSLHVEFTFLILDGWH